MIHFKYSQVFKEKKIQDKADKANTKSIKSIGAYMRKIAQRKIKYRKGAKPSQPGKAPFTHETKTLKNSIVFASDNQRTVIGPAKSKAGEIGALHEFGGKHEIFVSGTPVKKKYSVGDVGPIPSRIYKTAGRMKNTVYKSQNKDPLGGEIVWVVLRSPRMVMKANRLAERLRRKEFRRTATYPARPFMGPTLKENIQKVPSMLRASIKE